MVTVRPASSAVRIALLAAALLSGGSIMDAPGGTAACAQETATAAVYYVATNGDDAWSGKLDAPNDARTDGPFATLERAREAVRELKARGLERAVRVVVRGGVYELRETVSFAPEDSGTEACPITYEAHAGERVVLRGSRTIGGWRPFRHGIYQADLRAQRLEGVSFHQLFYRGERQVLARHPNFDPERPRTGGFIYMEDRGPRPPEEFVYSEGDIPFDQWDDISQAEVRTVFGYGWNFAITPILEVDTARRVITTGRVRRPFERLNRFFVQDVLGALDAPGEWFLDRETSTLYFSPPDAEPAEGEVLVPVLDDLIAIDGSLPYPHGYLHVNYKGSREDFPVPEDAPAENPVEHLTFRRFHLECARQNGFRLTGARHCSIIGNMVTNVGSVGINLGGVASAHQEVGNPRVVEATGFSGGVGGGGQNLLFNDPCEECRVEGNDVWSVGSDGIFLYGTGNVAENNHVYNSGLFDKDCASINLWGERNTARRNELHDVPRNAVFLKGVENVVELNNIHHTMLETCDGGAVRMCQRNLTLRGNIIRFNRIIDTIGYGYPRNSNTFQSPYYSWGVYLDDFTCGTTVYGNIIVRTGRGGVMVHGGSDNLVENNVVVDAGSYQFEQVPIRDDPISGNRVVRNILACNGDDAYTYRCSRWVEGSLSFGHNLVWTRGQPARIDLGRGGKQFGDWEAWVQEGLDQASILADPRFVNPDADDYRLAADSRAWELGFKELPVEEIGCYESPARSSWPVDADAGVVREEPLLYSAPVRAVREDFELDMPGRPPRHGDVMDAPKARIVVTAEHAAEGKHSLKVTDALDLRQVWLPRIFYPLDHQEGRVRFCCELRLDANQPPRLYIDPRQYSDTGDREYFSGPMLHINEDGSLTAAGKRLGEVPFDRWFKIEMEIVLGEGAPDATNMVLTVADEEPQQITVPHISPEFQRLERVVIASLKDGASVFYMDNVIIEPLAE